MLSAIYQDYAELSDLSWNARYRATKYGSAEILDATNAHAAIEQHIRALL